MKEPSVLPAALSEAPAALPLTTAALARWAPVGTPRGDRLMLSIELIRRIPYSGGYGWQRDRLFDDLKRATTYFPDLKNASDRFTAPDVFTDAGIVPTPQDLGSVGAVREALEADIFAADAARVAQGKRP